MTQSLGSATQKDFRDDLTVNTSPSFVSSDSDLNPVVIVGRGVERPNAKQSVKTFIAAQSGINTTYWQVATASASTRVFFLGVQVIGKFTSTYYLEDAASGNITPTDNSTVGLASFANPVDNTPCVFNTPPRECKMGIRLRVTNSAGTSSYTIVYFLVERIDAQVQDI